jgi:hypothetical protein
MSEPQFHVPAVQVQLRQRLAWIASGIQQGRDQDDGLSPEARPGHLEVHLPYAQGLGEGYRGVEPRWPGGGGPLDQPIPFAEALPGALLPPGMPAGHEINAPLAQQGHRGKGAKDAVAQHDIPGRKGGPQAVEERLVMVHKGPTGVVHQGAGRQRHEGNEFQHGEATAGCLLGRLWIGCLIVGGIG